MFTPSMIPRSIGPTLRLMAYTRLRNGHRYLTLLNDEQLVDIDRPELMFEIASHPNSRLCLDYRTIRVDGLPGVTYLDGDARLTRCTNSRKL